MENNNSQSSGNGPPPKPWERAGGPSSSGPAPFKPSSAGNTSDVVEASGTAQPGEIVSTTTNAAAANRNTLGRPVPARPWEQQQQQTSYGTTYGGGYNSGLNYNSGYGSNMYGSSYGGLGGSYGGGMYGNSMYRGNVGGMYGGGSMYGGGMYGGGSMYGGGAMGSYGMGMGMGMGVGGAPFGEQDPNNPFGAPPSPPGFWISVMRVMQGVVNFFGRLSILIDQNTQAFHMFMSALLQLFDRSGMLYGELARFVLRILGVKTKPNKVYPPGMNGLPGPQGHQNMMEGPKAAPAGAWDGVWGGNAN